MQTDIANSMKTYALDRELMQKSHVSSSARALMRRSEASKKAAQRAMSTLSVNFINKIIGPAPIKQVTYATWQGVPCFIHSAISLPATIAPQS